MTDLLSPVRRPSQADRAGRRLVRVGVGIRVRVRVRVRAGVGVRVRIRVRGRVREAFMSRHAMFPVPSHSPCRGGVAFWIVMISVRGSRHLPG